MGVRERAGWLAEGGNDRLPLDKMSMRCQGLPGRAGLQIGSGSRREDWVVTESRRPVCVQLGIRLGGEVIHLPADCEAGGQKRSCSGEVGEKPVQELVTEDAGVRKEESECPVLHSGR